MISICVVLGQFSWAPGIVQYAAQFRKVLRMNMWKPIPVPLDVGEIVLISHDNKD